MQHDTQIQTLHVIAMNLGWVLFHTMQPDADTPIQTLNAADITCHSCEPGGVPSHTTQHDTQIQTFNATDIYHSREPGDMLSHTTQHDTQIHI